jgi:cytosine/adenosine deaminase-related metal-dependent hydrolase
VAGLRDNAPMHTPTTAIATRTPRGWALPGIANLHSHAFQRAMAGLAERQTDPADSFWTWRETMYAMAARFDPDLLHAVAAQLYAEMLEAGYTTVCEFHYLHHAPDGTPYAQADAMSQALLRRRARHRHPHHPAAGAVHDRRVRWRPLSNASAASATIRRRLPALARDLARQRKRHRAHRLRPAQPARGAVRPDA